MTIVHLSKMTGAAGTENHLQLLVRGLREQSGMDAQLWILVEPDNPMQAYVDDLAAHHVPVERIVIHHDLDPGLWRRLAARFRATAPEIVHTHLLHADLYGIPAARRASVPHVVSSRHNDDRFRRFLPMRILQRWLWSQLDAGIAISEAIREFSVAVEGAPADRIHTIHYGLDPVSIGAAPGARAALCDRLQVSADALIVGSACRLVEQKGLLYGIRGFAQIADRVPEAHYVIAGDGPLADTLSAEVETLNLQDRIHFLGWQDDAHAFIAALDVLLAPSLWEGFGLVFLEAMALNVPIISTRVSAIPEVVVDGTTGWLIPPRDSAAVAAALLDAMTNPVRTRERGTNGRHRLETQFTTETMVERTLAVYHALGANIATPTTATAQ